MNNRWLINSSESALAYASIRKHNKSDTYNKINTNPTKSKAASHILRGRRKNETKA